jgi:citrate synthase
MMDKTNQIWDMYNGVFRTKKGGWTITNGIITHGYSLLDDLLGKISFFQLLILHVTGKLPERRLADWLEAAYMCLSWPDPRIWCNFIGSLGGSARVSPVSAICAGTLAADSRIYGVGTLKICTKFIVSALTKYDEYESAEGYIEKHCNKGGKLITPGFARPLAKGDERVEAIQNVVAALHFEDGPHLKLAYEISNYLVAQYDESLNFAGYVSAFLADQGFSPDEVERVFSLWVNGGVHACYSEASENVPDSFLPLRCDDILYAGVEERRVPDAG